VAAVVALSLRLICFTMYLLLVRLLPCIVSRWEKTNSFEFTPNDVSRLISGFSELRPRQSHQRCSFALFERYSNSGIVHFNISSVTKENSAPSGTEYYKMT